MSQSYFGNTLTYKIRQVRSKKNINPSQNQAQIGTNSKDIQFFLHYQQCQKPQCRRRSQIINTYQHRIRQKDKIFPFPRMQQNKQAITDIFPPKKISVNFELFNPKKKLKQQNQNESKLQNFQEIMMLSKQKYYEKVEKQNRKKTQKCKELKNFGLNIKTIERSQDVQRSPKKNCRVKEYVSNSPTRNSTIQTAANKYKERRNFSQNREFSVTRQKSKEFVQIAPPSPEKLVFKSRIQKMINSHNLVLMSYGYYSDEKESSREGKLKYYVGMGNNRNLIISIMRKRWWWTQTTDLSSANLVWTQLRHKSTLQKMQNYDIETMEYPDIDQILSLTQQKNKSAIFKAKSNFFNEKLRKRLNFYFTQAQKKKLFIPLKQPEYTHNHFSHNFMFGNKNALFQNLSIYYKYLQKDVYQIIPMTYFVQGYTSKKFEQFTKNTNSIKNTIWIVKPGENSNRGNGIFVANSVEQIKQRLSRKKSSKHTYIIQKYITNLFLYQKRKFDIRSYMLMISIGGVNKFYWYNQGYIRTSSEIFDPQELSDFFIHLTNDAVQVKNQNYGKYQPGNKISFGQFQNYLNANFKEDNYEVKKLNIQMKKIATEAVKAVYNKVNPQPKVFGFEMFGLDFIVDQNFRPWLIQINTNPSLQINSPVVQRIIPQMIQNIFRISIDPIFQPNDDCSRARSYFLYQNCLQKNKFQLIFDSLFDRDVNWQKYSSKINEKVEGNQFDNQSDQVINNE